MQQLSSEKIEKLIDLVKVKPAIYDKTEKLYKNIDWRDNAWKEIAEKVEADEKVCRTAWRSLRDQFSKCIKEEKGRSGQEATDGGRKQYKFFKNLVFLKNSCEPRKTSCNFVSEESVSNVWQDVDFWNEVDEFRQQRHSTSSPDNLSLMSPPSILPEKATCLSSNMDSSSASNQPSCSRSSCSDTPSKRKKVDTSDEKYGEFLEV